MLACLVALSLTSGIAGEFPTVTISNGQLIGIQYEASLDPTANMNFPLAVDAYLGIPYAERPVRFARPVALRDSWSSPRSAKEFGSDCLQLDKGAALGSEDCLFLNVYKPSVTDGSLLPVMVWIHGGSFSMSGSNVYDFAALASNREMVVVSMNYRLGVLGFYASASTLESEGTTGNWGMLDQRLALEWVREEISRFGGDPTRVTLVGESAGAFSVQWHLVSRGSFNLFSQAIVMSGGAESNWIYQQPEDSFAFYDWASRVLARCDNLDCMRSVPASRLLIRNSDRDFPRAPERGSPLFAPSAFGPTIDGVELLGTPGDLVRRRLWADVPLIIGVVKDEGSLFATQVDKTVRLNGESVVFPMKTIEDAIKVLRYFFPTNNSSDRLEEYIRVRTAPLKARFSKSPKSAAFTLTSSFLRDTMFHCPSLDIATAVQQQNGQVWFYDFAFNPFPPALQNIPLSAIELNLDTTGEVGLNTFHASELPFAFLLFPNSPLELNKMSIRNPWSMFTSPPFAQPNMHAMANGFSCLLGNFIKGGNPNSDPLCGMTDGSPPLPEWTMFDANQPAYLSLDLQADGRVGLMRSVPSSAFPEGVFADGVDLEISDIETCNLLHGVKYEFTDLLASAKLPWQVVSDNSFPARNVDLGLFSSDI